MYVDNVISLCHNIIIIKKQVFSRETSEVDKNTHSTHAHIYVLYDKRNKWDEKTQNRADNGKKDRAKLD
jgi:hypothetical protein